MPYHATDVSDRGKNRTDAAQLMLRSPSLASGGLVWMRVFLLYVRVVVVCATSVYVNIPSVYVTSVT